MTFDFSAEWSSLLALDVNLQNNGIEYTAGFKTSSSKWDTWIKFKVRTGELASDLHIGSMTPSSGGSNSQDYDAYIAIDGTAAANQLWDLPDTGGDGEKYFKLAASGTRFTTAISPDPGTGWNMNTQTIYSLHEHTFIIHRWKSYGGIGAVIYKPDKDGNVIINEPYAGSPAVRYGLRCGDEILEIFEITEFSEILTIE